MTPSGTIEIVVAMPTYEDWRERVNRLAKELRSFAKAKNGQTVANERPALLARVRMLLSALRSADATPRPQLVREEKLVGALAVIEARLEAMDRPMNSNQIWGAAEGAADALENQLLSAIDEIYRLDGAPNAAVALTLPPALPPPPPPRPPVSGSAPRDIGRWRVLRALPAGYQGEVFLVSGLPADGQGVLKRMPQRRFTDDKARVRFLREIAILRRLKHPAIVRVLDARTTGDDPYLVTELALHGSMADHVATLRGDTWRCLRIARDLAAALGAAHAQGIVHRDVKPKNLFFFSLDRVAVGDFGIAHEADATSVTSANEQVGARCFSPPEWESGHIQPTPSFDVYSLGKVLYYMLGGGTCPPRETYRDPRWNLEGLLSRPEMRHVNRLLDRMVVENAAARLQTMPQVIEEIDRTMSDLFGGAPPAANSCRLCYRGIYRQAGDWVLDRKTENSIVHGGHSVEISAFNPMLLVCDQCGDVRVIFRSLGGLVHRPVWRHPDE